MLTGPSLADAFAIFAYYLRHRANAGDYLVGQEREGAEIQARIEAVYPPDGLAGQAPCSLDS